MVKFRFIESASYKIRPVVVASSPHGSYGAIIGIPVSGTADNEDVDVRLKHWRESGLRRPSVVRVHRLTAIMGKNILEEIGQISTTDESAIRIALRKLLGL